MERPLYWSQGLFLSPQHFQLLERNNQSLLTPFYKFIEPYFWGVGKIDIEKPAVGNLTFSINEGEFLFVDGTHVVFPGNALVEARSFEEDWIEGDKPLTVLLGIKKFKSGQKNVTVVEEPFSTLDINTRFVTPAAPEEISDSHDGEITADVQRLQYVLKIFWSTEKEKLGEYLYFPLANLERVGDEVRLSEIYVPPSLSISSSETLFKLVKEIRDQVATHGRRFEAHKRQKGIQSAEFGSRDMVYLLALRTLNRFIPLLYHYTETDPVHPWTIYGILRQLIGELSSFSERVTATGEFLEDRTRSLPPYDHYNLWYCFSIAQILIAQLIDEITIGPEETITLIFDGTYYSAELPPTIFEGTKQYYLAVTTEDNEEEVINSLSGLAKLSSFRDVTTLYHRALPGAKLTYLKIIPQELPRRPQCLYFEISQHNPNWDSVKNYKNIALYWEDAQKKFKIKEIQLLVIGKY